MSLLDKLNQRKEQKKEEQIKAVEEEKKQSLAQINAQILETEEKRKRIKGLSDSLRSTFDSAKNKLSDFKNKKEVLKGAYEDSKDILEEDDGITSFEGMLEANEAEPEVKAYRKAGGRGPAKEKGAKKISSEEVGTTGDLYKAVGTIQELSKSLRAEMGIAEKDKKDLNFSAVKKDSEISNREANFIQIDEFLKTLDTKLVELNKQKEEAIADTPEGKREALLKIDNPKDTVRSVDFNNIDHFYFQDRVMILSEKTGAETIKDEYGWALRDKLQLVAWNKKPDYEKKTINSITDPEKSDQLSYEQREFLKSWREEMKAITTISTAAVESRFAQDWERYFSRKNKSFLEKIDYNKELTKQIEHSLKDLENGLFKDPEFVNRKIKLAKSSGGYNNDRVISDVSADEEYNRYHKEWTTIEHEIEEYAQSKKTEKEKATGSLWQIIPGYKKKLDALNKQWQIFEDFRKNRPLKEENLKKDGISDEEIKVMKEYRKKRNDNEAEYKRDDVLRLKFLHASDAKSFYIGFKPGKDILDGQEMIIEELPERLKARLAELKAELANLSESELAIVNERDRSVEAVKVNTEKFQKVAVENSDVIRKNYK